MSSLRGAATRAQLRAAGVTDREMAKAVAAGVLVRARRGVYLPGSAPVWSVSAAAAAGGVISYSSARGVWGIDGPTVAHVNRTVGRNWNGRRMPGETVHRQDLGADEITECDGQLVTTPLRTVLDEARVLPLPWAVAVADSALHLGLISDDELRLAAAATRGRGASRIRRVASMADGRSESVLESLARVALILAGLEPEVQVWIGRMRVDLIVGNVVIELDGFEYHRKREDYRSDRRRCNALTARGYRVLRFSWEDVVSDPAYVVAKVREALALEG